MRILTALGRIAARQVYFDAQKRAYRLQGELTRPHSGVARAVLIGQLADVQRQMADVYPAAFGPDPIPDEGGRDMAESERLAGVLLALVADAEYAAVSGGQRMITYSELERHAGPVLDRIAATGDPEERGRMLDDLYDAVVDVVGGQAAETIACLPAPGRNVPVTLWDHLDTLMPTWALEVLWGVAVSAVAVVVALLVDRPHAGVAATVAASVAAGITMPLRPAGMPATAAVPFSAALGLLAGATVHHFGPRWLVVTVVLACACAGKLLWARAARR